MGLVFRYLGSRGASYLLGDIVEIIVERHPQEGKIRER